jgi:hypothetical protein
MIFPEHILHMVAAVAVAVPWHLLGCQVVRVAVDMEHNMLKQETVASTLVAVVAVATQVAQVGLVL